MIEEQFYETMFNVVIVFSYLLTWANNKINKAKVTATKDFGLSCYFWKCNYWSFLYQKIFDKWSLPKYVLKDYRFHYNQLSRNFSVIGEGEGLIYFQQNGAKFQFFPPVEPEEIYWQKESNWMVPRITISNCHEFFSLGHLESIIWNSTYYCL